MNRLLSVGIIFCWLLSIPALYGQAKSGKQGQIELSRQIIQMRRQEIVNQMMTLTKEESEPFWQLYQEWRGKQTGLGDRKVTLITQLGENVVDLTDDKAKTMLDEWMKIQEDELQLKKEYLKKFRKILPERKVARFFQLESKMDAAVAYDLAGKVLMVEVAK
jgi:hypothetical protein